MDIKSLLPNFNSDLYENRLISLRSNEKTYEEKSEYHKHYKGQLIMPTKGTVTSTIENLVWLSYPGVAIWIPSEVYHSNLIATNSEICMVFIDPSISTMPKEVCTLSISPLIRELIIYLSSQPLNDFFEKKNYKAIDLLADQLSQMKKEFYNFPLTANNTLRNIASEWISNPSNRKSIREWANKYAMSEKTLTRLVKKHTGLTFDQWKKKFYVVLTIQKLNQGIPIQTISQDLGYESVSSFTTFFKKIFKCSPKRYIKTINS